MADPAAVPRIDHGAQRFEQVTAAARARPGVGGRDPTESCWGGLMMVEVSNVADCARNEAPGTSILVDRPS